MGNSDLEMTKGYQRFIVQSMAMSYHRPAASGFNLDPLITGVISPSPAIPDHPSRIGYAAMPERIGGQKYHGNPWNNDK